MIYHWHLIKHVEKERHFLYEEILCSISEDSTLQNLWKNYCRKYKYASHIEFSTNLEIIKQLMSQMLEIE